MPSTQGLGQVGVSQNRGYPFGVPIMRLVIFWGQYWGPLILGNYQVIPSIGHPTQRRVSQGRRHPVNQSGVHSPPQHNAAAMLSTPSLQRRSSVLPAQAHLRTKGSAIQVIVGRWHSVFGTRCCGLGQYLLPGPDFKELGNRYFTVSIMTTFHPSNHAASLAPYLEGQWT